ncbi:RNA polymerase factor sigma-54 [Paenibacillus elgii]|uniref:RNA polymerase factor sigma-54 n=1 Tax=Paenibacillus elgii TaxID=189691 RepID=UPI000248C69D|nr:RNA polymerase factor sigma-54 [Paenibacillus elgii]
MQFDNALLQVHALKLNLTPELKQSIHILQCSSAELSEYLQTQAVENPLVELVWPGSEKRRRERGRQKPGGAWEDDGEPAWHRVASQTDTLETALLSQLRLLDLPWPLDHIARYIAGNLDTNGYLVCGLEEIGRACRADESDVRLALRQVQSLEPTGVGARSLWECLQIQIRVDAAAHPNAEAIVTDHWEDLVSGKWKRIADKMSIRPDEVRAALDYIRSLNPRPGAAYDAPPPVYAAPDAIVSKAGDSFRVDLCDAGVPCVTVNEDYRKWLPECRDELARQYLNEHLMSAKWLIRALEQRKATLQRVVEAIVEEQGDFFHSGVSYLKPMSLKPIANRLGIHESTVSRATQHKFVLSPQGLSEMKSFFSGGIASADGTASASGVKESIKRLIENEDKRSPLSDQRIAEILMESGICISRRTVVKYREELRLLSSRLRRSG